MKLIELIKSKKETEALDWLNTYAVDIAYFDPITRDSLIHYAVREGLIKVTEKLLSLNAEPYYYNSYRENALTIASQKGHTHIITLILNHSCTTKESIPDVIYGLHKEKDYSLIKNTCERFQLDFNLQMMIYGPLDEDANCSIHLAVLNNNTGLLAYLLSIGANPYYLNKKYEHALSLAISKGHADCIELIINSRNDISNYIGLTVCFAVKVEDPNLLLRVCTKADKERLKLGIDGATVGDDYAIMMATKLNNPSMVQILLDFGADPYRKNKNGFSAVSRARRMGFNALCRIITDFQEAKLAANPNALTDSFIHQLGTDSAREPLPECKTLCNELINYKSSEDSAHARWLFLAKTYNTIAQRNPSHAESRFFLHYNIKRLFELAFNQSQNLSISSGPTSLGESMLIFLVNSYYEKNKPDADTRPIVQKSPMSVGAAQKQSEELYVEEEKKDTVGTIKLSESSDVFFAPAHSTTTSLRQRNTVSNDNFVL